MANGPRQSPINIVPKEAQYDSSLKALKLKYDPSDAKGILNNGHSFQVDFVDDTDSSSKQIIFFFLIQYIFSLHILRRRRRIMCLLLIIKKKPLKGKSSPKALFAKEHKKQQ